VGGLPSAKPRNPLAASVKAKCSGTTNHGRFHVVLRSKKAVMLM